ncbi:unnamed protein product [Discosporangium mesarthrocarpum]
MYRIALARQRIMIGTSRVLRAPPSISSYQRRVIHRGVGDRRSGKGRGNDRQQLKIGLVGLGVGAVTFWYVNQDEVPYSKRSRFLIFSKGGLWLVLGL